MRATALLTPEAFYFFTCTTTGIVAVRLLRDGIAGLF
jgi:hypothetical protein